MSEHDTSDRDEARLRAGFEALRAHDAQSAPAFARTWAAAAAASRPRPALRSWLLAAATASVLLAAVGGGVALWATASGPAVSPAADRALAVEVASLHPEPLAFLAAAPAGGVLGGGGWFEDDGRRSRPVEASW